MGVEIIIPLSKINGAKHGQKVLTKITAWPKGSNTSYGEVSAILGASGSNDAEMLSILYNHGIEPEFPQEVIEEAEYVKIELEDSEIKKRRDFSGMFLHLLLTLLMRKILMMLYQFKD